MTDRLILTILIALACPLLLPIVIEEEAEEDAAVLRKMQEGD